MKVRNEKLIFYSQFQPFLHEVVFNNSLLWTEKKKAKNCYHFIDQLEVERAQAWTYKFGNSKLEPTSKLFWTRACRASSPGIIYCEPKICRGPSSPSSGSFYLYDRPFPLFVQRGHSKLWVWLHYFCSTLLHCDRCSNAMQLKTSLTVSQQRSTSVKLFFALGSQKQQDTLFQFSSWF